MKKVFNYFTAWIILMIIYAGLTSWGVSSIPRFVLGCLYWLWISNLIDEEVRYGRFKSALNR